MYVFYLFIVSLLLSCLFVTVMIFISLFMLLITAMPFCGSISTLFTHSCHAFFVTVLLYYLFATAMLFCGSFITFFNYSVMLFCDSIILTEQIILYGLERMAVFRCLR